MTLKVATRNLLAARLWPGRVAYSYKIAQSLQPHQPVVVARFLKSQMSRRVPAQCSSIDKFDAPLSLTNKGFYEGDFLPIA